MSKRESSIERVERLLAGSAPTRLAPAAVDELARRWRETFAQRVHQATGEWTHFGFDWHAFSYGLVNSVSGEAARAEYRNRQRQQKFVVLVGPMMSSGFACVSETLPWLERAALDVYIVAPSFDWTMVFTHESDWCGPYFTTAQWAKAAASSSS